LGISKRALFLNMRQPNFIITTNTLIKPSPQLAIREYTIYIDNYDVPVAASEQYIHVQAIPPGSGDSTKTLFNYPA